MAKSAFQFQTRSPIKESIEWDLAYKFFLFLVDWLRRQLYSDGDDVVVVLLVIVVAAAGVTIFDVITKILLLLLLSLPMQMMLMIKILPSLLHVFCSVQKQEQAR